MEWLWAAVPALACGAMMVVMFVPMFMNRKANNTGDAVSKEDVAALRVEVARLRAAQVLESKPEEATRG
ncbi:MAG: hypothetical protein M3N53_12760 [Actinomycetota bacterium]|nr:hypothetical protein [Actinomycetota bacterium]